MRTHGLTCHAALPQVRPIKASMSADHSSQQESLADDSLHAAKMNLSDGGDKAMMRDGWFVTDEGRRLAVAMHRLALAAQLALLLCGPGPGTRVRDQVWSELQVRVAEFGEFELPPVFTAQILRKDCKDNKDWVPFESPEEFFRETYTVRQSMTVDRDEQRIPRGLESMLRDRPGRWTDEHRGKTVSSKNPTPKKTQPLRRCVCCQVSPNTSGSFQ